MLFIKSPFSGIFYIRQFWIYCLDPLDFCPQTLLNYLLNQLTKIYLCHNVRSDLSIKKSNTNGLHWFLNEGFFSILVHEGFFFNNFSDFDDFTLKIVFRKLLHMVRKSQNDHFEREWRWFQLRYFSLISVILFSSLVIYYLEAAVVAVIEW